MIELPFTVEEFFGVFQSYNDAIWPSQVIAYVLGFLIILLAFKNTPASDKFIHATLGAFWLWTGFVYHILFFSQINTAAYLFGFLFMVQGGLFMRFSLFPDRLGYQFRADVYGITGIILILYAMIVYPAIGSMLGHSYPFSPMFGVAPCPVTIFTFGLLLWTSHRIAWWLLIIPGLWSVIGFSAAMNLGMVEDAGLVVAGILGISLLVYRNAKIKGKTSHPEAQPVH